MRSTARLLGIPPGPAIAAAGLVAVPLLALALWGWDAPVPLLLPLFPFLLLTMFGGLDVGVGKVLAAPLVSWYLYARFFAAVAGFFGLARDAGRKPAR